jgi:KUP system potassium uptake protein
MADSADGAAKATEESHHSPHKESFAALALGAMGVVFGDIGTSPLYAMREALAHSKATVSSELSVLGVISLVTWALVLIVTIK